jgi:hypothetical protein
MSVVGRFQPVAKTRCSADFFAGDEAGGKWVGPPIGDCTKVVEAGEQVLAPL